MHAKTDFVPAAHWHFLTPYYHGFMKLFFGKRYKKLSDLIALKSGETLLDVGCGPGQLLRLLHAKYPQNSFTGLDVDPEILAIARKNLTEGVKLIESSATELPFPDQSVDAVTSTLMIHHLSSEQKQRMIREVYRVLKPGGRFYLFDFAPPKSWYEKLVTAIICKVEQLEDAASGKYPEFMKQARFKDVQSLYHTRRFGRMELLKGEKP